MPRAERPFVRVYHDDLQKDYAAVWDDDHLLATWLRLLVVADKMWPTPGEIPRRERPNTIARLAATKILQLLPHHRFRLKGLDAERQRRAAAGRVGADVRWPSKGDPSAIPSDDIGNASRGQAGASALRPPSSDSVEPSDGESAVLAWLASVGATIVPDGNGYHRDLVLLVGRQGAPAVIAAMQARLAAGDRSARQLLYGASNELERIHRPKDRKAPAVAGDIEERVRAFRTA
jgi:hypothetical protein